MDQLLAQYPWLFILAAFLVGMLIMWLLELFILRRNIKSNLTELDASLKQRDAELQTARTGLDQTEAALKSKSNELTTALNGRAAAETQVADLKAQLAKNAAELDAARQTRQQLETTVNTRTAEANDLRTKFTAAAAERDELRTGLNNAQAELEDTRAHHRGAISEVTKLTATAAATAAVVKSLETSKSDLTTQITALNGELSTARGDAEYLRNRLDETATAKANLENQLAETAQRAEDLGGIKTALEGQVVQLQDKNSALDADVAKLTAGALAASEFIKLLEGDKAALTAQKTKLQGDFDALQKAKALDDAELAEHKLQLSQVNTALGITKRDKESYQQTLAARVTELGEAQAQLVRAKEDNNNLLSDIAKFSARAAAAAALVQGLEGSKRDLSAQVEQLRGELDSERVQTAEVKQTPATTPESAVKAETIAAPAVAISAAAAAAEREDARAIPLESVCPQDLSSVHGVGAEFEQRLYDAGIGTYWELSQRTEQELAHILELGDVQHTSVNLSAIRGDALRLARETKTQNRTWKGGTPDDFDRIKGIGRVYEGRLYEAGICTYAALSKCTVEQLAAICRAPQFNANHYQGWIDQARALTAG